MTNLLKLLADAHEFVWIERQARKQLGHQAEPGLEELLNRLDEAYTAETDREIGRVELYDSAAIQAGYIKDEDGNWYDPETVDVDGTYLTSRDLSLAQEWPAPTGIVVVTEGGVVQVVQDADGNVLPFLLVDHDLRTDGIQEYRVQLEALKALPGDNRRKLADEMLADVTAEIEATELADAKFAEKLEEQSRLQDTLRIALTSYRQEVLKGLPGFSTEGTADELFRVDTLMQGLDQAQNAGAEPVNTEAANDAAAA